MIKIIRAGCAEAAQIENMHIQRDNDVERAVDEIIGQVRAQGDQALIRYTQMFDGVALENIEVSRQEIDEAFEQTDKALIETLRQARQNIENFHAHQVRSSFIVSERAGVTLGQRVIPLKRVGIYVPGGTAAYPSSVLMNAVPPKLAGVGEIVMTTPPGKDGRVEAAILCAARIAGVDRVFKCGGAQAVAALAYGTRSVPRVDKIVGPGNIYVATAKRRVYGLVDIDMIAGPSEILVLADESANARNVAADMLSQAEHDKFSSAVLVTDCERLALKVQQEIERQLEGLPRYEIARASIENNGRIILVSGMDEGLEIANQIAPEHMEIVTREPFALLGGVRNAGSVFLGGYAPEALGDYWAGPNHVLPTSGTARFSSPLSVDDFVKKSQFMCYTREALEQAAPSIARFARSEGLEAHARSALIRFEEDGREK